MTCELCSAPGSKVLFNVIWLWRLSRDLVVAQSCLALCDPVDCSMPGFPVHHQLLELAQTHVHWSLLPSNHLILCHPLLLLPSIFPSIRVFFNESVLCIRWPKYWSFRKHKWAFKNTILPKCNLAVIYALGKNMPVITASNIYILNLKTFIHFNLIVCLWELTLNTQNAKMLYAHKCL